MNIEIENIPGTRIAYIRQAGTAFTKTYVGYVNAVSHSFGGKYGIANGLSNSVLLPYVLEAYGSSIYKKLWKLAIASGIAGSEDSYQTGAGKFINTIKDLNNYIGIPEKLEVIREEDINELAHYADKEANPLYPVPVLMDAEELKVFYRMALKEGKYGRAANQGTDKETA